MPIYESCFETFRFQDLASSAPSPSSHVATAGSSVGSAVAAVDQVDALGSDGIVNGAHHPEEAQQFQRVTITGEDTSGVNDAPSTFFFFFFPVPLTRSVC